MYAVRVSVKQTVTQGKADMQPITALSCKQNVQQYSSLTTQETACTVKLVFFKHARTRKNICYFKSSEMDFTQLLQV
jgi:hypothetical protein